jgi:hypothetical protein
MVPILSPGSRVRAPAVFLALAVAQWALPAWSDPDPGLGPRERVAAAATQGAPVDARWTPWLGCWTPDDGVPVEGTTPTPAVLVCVSPAEGRSGIVIRTFVDDRVILEEGIAADGQQHPPREAGCQGWQLEEWSSSGKRIFTSAESTCAGERFVRLSGFTTITPDDRWVDIQAVTAGGRTGMRVRGYRRFLGPRPATSADQDPLPHARVGPMTFDEVKEASAKLVPVVVEAAIAETRVEFTANAKSVVALADAGVSRRVIDLIIALDYPNRFVIMRARPGRPWTRVGLAVEQIEPVVVGGYAPFAYFYEDGFWDDPGFIDLEPDPPVDGGGGGGSGGGPGVSRGQLVKGLGYTRIEPRSSEPASGGSGSSSGETSSPKEGSGTATSQGYSSGASGEGTRTAQPRPPQ